MRERVPTMPERRGLKPARRFCWNGTLRWRGAVVGSALARGTRFSLLAGPRGLKPAALCRAFSLAEVMIAIGILGVGLLMVAATFPVGLDQSRIVTEQTIGTIMIPPAAAKRLALLVKEPAWFKRIPDNAANPVQWPYSFRESLRQAIPPAVAVGVFYGPVRAHVSNGNPAQDPLSPLTPAPYAWTGLNELLVAPYIPGATLGAPPQSAGAGTRFYPEVAGRHALSQWPWDWSLPLRTDAAGQPSLVPPPYTWSALYRTRQTVLSLSPLVEVDEVQFFVFVNRRGQEWPGDWPVLANFGQVDLSGAPDSAAAQGHSVGNEIWFPPNHPWPAPTVTPARIYDVRQMTNISNSRVFGMLSEGAYLLGLDGTLCQIKQIQKAVNLNNSDANSTNPDDFHRITLSIPPTTGFFWFVPADVNAGRSPCIWVHADPVWHSLQP